MHTFNHFFFVRTAVRTYTYLYLYLENYTCNLSRWSCMKLLALLVRRKYRKLTEILVCACWYKLTKISCTNSSRQKKTTDARSSRVVGGAGFLPYRVRSFTTGKIYYTMHPPARTNRSQTGIPGASRTQALDGGHRAVAVHAICRYMQHLLPQSACFLRLVILWPKNEPY